MSGTATGSWDDLDRALGACAEAGRHADFWWRDDDAADATDALDRLFSLRAALDISLALAVIPANATPALADAVRAQKDVFVLQHGYAHVNHRPAGAKKAELGADRDAWDVARELADGRSRLIELFDAEAAVGPDAVFDGSTVEIMAPPWNRIDPAICALLPGLGYRGLTTFRARNASDARPDLRIVNTHIDLIDWPASRAFAGEGALLAAAVEALAAQAEDPEGPAAAVGLLSHHLAHDPGCWDFIERFVAKTRAHPAVRWRSADALFPLPQ